MAGGFQVGSIFAKIGLDVQPMQQGARQAVAIADRLAKDVQARLSRAGVGVGKALGFDEKDLAKKALSARRIFKALVEGTNKEFLNFREIQLSKLGLSRNKLAQSFSVLRGEFAKFRGVASRELQVIGDSIAPRGSKLRNALANIVAQSESAAASIRSKFQSALVIPSGKLASGFRSALAGIPAIARRVAIDPTSRLFAQLGAAASRHIVEPFRRGFAGIPELARRRVLLPLEQTFQQVATAARTKLILPAGFERQVSVIGEAFRTKLAVPFTRAVETIAAGAGTVLSKLSPLGRFSVAGSRLAIQALQTSLLLLGRTGALSIGVLAKSFGVLQASASITGRVLAGVAKLAIFQFKALRGTVDLLLKPFGALRNFFFSLKGIAVGFAAFKLVSVAKDAEKTGAAFASLSRQIGATADTFLGKLRVATKGTISDLRLMQLANEAVLLGVARNSDDFADLAGKVGQLGETFGKTSAESIDTFIQGIASMQSRTLRSIGIIVDAEAAVAEYKVSVGKAGEEIGEMEQRTAFADAVTRKLNEQMGKLSGALTPVTTGFERLGASLSNTFAIISEAIVGGRVPEAIANLLDRNQQKIAAFAKFVGDSIGSIVDGVFSLISQIESGALSASNILRGVTRLLTNVVTSVMSGVIRVAFSVLKQAVINFFPAVLQVAVRLILDLVPGLVSEIARLILIAIRAVFPAAVASLLGIETVKEINEKVKGLQQALTFGGADPNELKRIAQEEVEALHKFREEALKRNPSLTEGELRKLVEGHRKELEKLERFSGRPSVDILTEDATRNFIEGMKGIADDTGDILSDAFDKVGTGLREDFGPLVDVVFGGISRAAKKVGFDIRDALAFFKPIQVDSSVQGLSDFLSATVRLRRELIETGSAFFDNPFFRDTSATVIGKLRQGIEAVSGAVKDLRDKFKPATVDAVRFERAVDPILKGIQQIELEADTRGLDEATVKIEAIRREIEKLNALPGVRTPDQQGIEDALTPRLFQAFARSELAEITNQVGLMNDELRGIGLSDADRKVLEIDRRFAGLAVILKEHPELLAAVRKELDGLTQKPFEIEVKMKIQEFEGQLDQLQAEAENLGLSQGQVLAKQIDLQILRLQTAGGATQEQLDKLNLQRQQALDIQGRIDFQGLTKDVSTSIFSGILDAFERGEGLSKVWSAVVSDIFRSSMQRVINGLTDTISVALGKVFSELGGGAGAAGLATGLLGIGSTILVGLKNRSNQTVNDFAQQVNSSEAVRGVVAGQTNVAIAKVGDSFKVALRTVESQLERIARAVERGGGGGTANGGGFPASTRLMTSTQS